MYVSQKKQAEELTSTFPCTFLFTNCLLNNLACHGLLWLKVDAIHNTSLPILLNSCSVLTSSSLLLQSLRNAFCGIFYIISSFCFCLNTTTIRISFTFTVYKEFIDVYSVMDLINVLSGNSSVNTAQHATIEEAVFCRSNQRANRLAR
jgi:hypothetical protein